MESYNSQKKKFVLINFKDIIVANFHWVDGFEKNKLLFSPFNIKALFFNLYPLKKILFFRFKHMSIILIIIIMRSKSDLQIVIFIFQ
jgi:hypothetical protein